MAISAYERHRPNDQSKKIADACPACGFKYSDRGPTGIGQSVWPVANLSMIAAATAGAVFFVAWLVS